MITFEQFLLEKDKLIGKLYGLGTGHKSKLIQAVNPAKPHKPTYTGMAVQQILPVPRCGKGVMGS
jgi:hypothetical protein